MRGSSGAGTQWVKIQNARVSDGRRTKTTDIVDLWRRRCPGDRDPSCMAAHDDESAYDYFKQSSPNFVDYFLEPSVAWFTGYDRQDYSLA
jgi:hypothetical protein